MPMKVGANITIELPANATLFVDGVQVAGEGRVRQFHTPELPLGRQFFYEMRAEFPVEGRVASESVRVVVAGGEKVTKQFAELLAASEKATATKLAAK
jgi:uncharacterized protein (TIGR03000 family)